MSLSLSPSHLRRYRDVVALLIKYGRGDLVKDSPIVDDPLPFAAAPAVPPQAAELASDLEKLGPTFVKLGQLLSTRADLIPAAYLEALARLQDNVEPFSFNEVEAIVAVEIGARISKAFQEFEPTPMAAASLGQVHRAVLRSGQPVVVKVQRPGVRVPSELTMLGKTLLNLDLVGRTLHPDFDPNESIRRNGAAILQQRTRQSFSPSNLFAAMLEAKELLERLPSRLNQFLEMVATNKLRVQVDTIDPDFLMAGLQKIANRIALGLILAALIVGAAMLMRVQTAFRILGYPGFAIVFFLAASAGGLALVIQILRSDRPSK